MKLYQPIVTGSLRVTGSADFIGPVTFSDPLNVTSSQAISSSYATTASYALNAGSGVTGGTADYIPVWTGTDTLSTSSIYQSGSQNVAINTTDFDPTNPEALLVSGSNINVIIGTSNVDSYTQLNIINTNPGNYASADIVATNDQGTEQGNFVDLGINSSTFGGIIGGVNDAYLYSTGSSFLIGNTTRGNASLRFFSGNDATNFPLIVTGSQTLVTGSLLGTASYSDNSKSSVSSSYASQSLSSSYSISSSYALTASYAANVPATASYALQALSASYAVTASYAANVPATASYANQALSASYAQTASYFITSSVTSASYSITSSYVKNAETASYVLNSVSASYAATASYFVTNSVSSASYATTASYAQNANQAVTSLTASSADNFIVRQNITASNALITGTVTAQTLVVQTITSSVEYVTGSTQFGSQLSNTHQFTGSVSVTGSLQVNNSSVITQSQTASMSVLSSSYATTASYAANVPATASYANQALSASYASNADLLDGKDSTTFATTGSNIFKGNQTIDGNLFMSGAFRLVYNNDPTNNLLFGQFDGSSIYGPYYQLFGNQYPNLSQRGGAEFVYDVRNNSDANFHISSFNGSTWTQKLLVNDNGVQVTGSLESSGGITGSLYGTASWAQTSSIAPSYTLTSSFTSFTQSYNIDSASFSTRSTNNSASIATLSSSYLASSASFDTRILSNSSSLGLLSSSYLIDSASFSTRSTTNSSSITTLSSSYLASSSSFDARILNNSSSTALLSSSFLTTSASFSVVSSSYSILSSSFRTGSFTGSFSGSLFGSSSYALTASYFVTNSVTSASYSDTASYVKNSQTASYVLNAVSSSYAQTASYFVTNSVASSSYANTSSYVLPLNQVLIVSGALQLNPTLDPGPLNTSASYYFVSKSADNKENNLHYRNNGALWEQHWLEETVTTGILWGGVVTFVGTTLYITPGAGLIINYNANTSSHGDTTSTYVPFGPITASATYITSSQVTYLLIDENGNLQQQTTRFTQQQYTEKFPLGYIFSFTTSSIGSYADGRVTTYGQTQQQSSFVRAFGPLKVSGFDITAQTGSLKYSVAAGQSFRYGGFYSQQPNNPSIYDATSIDTGSIVRVYRDPNVTGGYRAATNAGLPYTVIDPTKWDDGTGTLQTVGNDEWTIQRVFQGVVNGVSYIYYGQNKYSSLSTAVQSITTEQFVESPTSILALPFIGYLIVKGNTTDLGNQSENRIIQAGLFRNTAGSSGGGGAVAQTLNDLSDVTITSGVTGQALVLDSGIWVNGYPATASYAYTASYGISSETASYAANYTLTSSFNAFTQSYTTDSSSFNTRILNVSSSVAVLSSSYLASSASFTVVSSSYNSFSASYLTDSGSFSTRLTNNSSSIAILSSSYLASSASFDTRILNVSSSTAILSASYLVSSASFAVVSSSYASLSSSYTTDSSSFNTRILNVSSSVATLSSSYLASSASFDTRILNNSSSTAILSASFLTVSSSFSIVSASYSSLSSSYTVDSSSFNTRILNNSSSLAILSSSYLTDSASFSTRVTNNSSSLAILSGSFLTVSSSFATLSSSYASLSGSFRTGSFTGSFTGSLFGSSSYALTASYAMNAGGGSAITIADEGTAQGTATFINFIGTAVTATVSSNTASISITGGSGASFPYTGSAQITGSLGVTGSITTRDSQVGINTVDFDPIYPEALFVSGSTINVIHGQANINTYAQLNISNLSNGTGASSDIVATNDAGTESGNYVDMGINSSTFTGLIGVANDAYLYNTGSNFLIGNTTRGTNANVKFFAGNDATVFPLVVTGSNVIATGSFTGSFTGNAASSSLYYVVKPTTTYNATATSGQIVILGNTTGGAFSVNLPTAVGNTAMYTVKKIAGAGALTIDANGSETIDGGLTAVLNVVSASVTLISDNSNWFII